MAGQSIGSSQPGMSSGPPSAILARQVLNRIFESSKQALAHQRPWQELADRNSFAKPESLADATNRVKKNLSYFRVNYMLILLGVIVTSMLINPISIIWVAVIAALWVYVFMVRIEPVIILGRVLSDREKSLALGAITVLVTFGLTPVGSVLVSGLILGFSLVLVHAAVRVPDDLFLDDQDAGGFLSWLGSGQSPNLTASLSHV